MGKLLEAAVGLFTKLLEKGVDIIGVFFASKPRLVCKLCPTPDCELLEKELRTKTSASEYGLEIINIGEKSFLIDSFSLCRKRDILVDGCEISREERCIEPRKSLVYTFMEQDAEALSWHCHTKKLKECEVHILSVDGKTAKFKLDVEPITIQPSVVDDLVL